MIVVVDSSALALLVNHDANPPTDPSTGAALTLARERIEKFVGDMDAKNDVLVVPTPVLAEILVKAGQGAGEVKQQLGALARVRVVPFDELAAVELAAMTIEIAAGGDKRGGDAQPWQKVKFDRQIIAIARVAQASLLYADDANLVATARRMGMTAISTWELPVPDVDNDLFAAAGIPTSRGPQID